MNNDAVWFKVYYVYTENSVIDRTLCGVSRIEEESELLGA